MRRSLFAAVAMLAACGLAMPPEPPDPALRVPPPFREIALVAAGARMMLQPERVLGRAPAASVTRAAFSDATVTWLGHAGLLVRQAGQSVLIDPVLDDSDEGWIAMLRRVGAPVDLSALDRLDAVLITHDHHDHFDGSTLAGLARRFPQARLILPRDAALETALPFADVARVEPWERLRLGALGVTAVPVVHHGSPVAGSGSTGARSLALGYALEGGGRSVLVAGDTALGEVFHDIGERLGPFHLALVPIGSGDPAPLLGHLHASPEDAVELARRVRAARAVPYHWGTFASLRVSHHSIFERFVLAAEAAGLEIATPPVGGTVPIAP